MQSVLLCFVGIGALFGGFLGMYDPYGKVFEMGTGVLKKGPFTTFFIPGLFLFVVIGLGHLTAFVATIKRMGPHLLLSGVVGIVLMSWIVIQCYMLQNVNILHVVFFIIGFGETSIAARIAWNS